MNPGMNEPEEAANDGSRPEATPVPGNAAEPADPKKNGTDRDGDQRGSTANHDPDAGYRTITPGPAEEEDSREADDRGLTTDTGSSD
jgi:hypothetical protein